MPKKGRNQKPPPRQVIVTGSGTACSRNGPIVKKARKASYSRTWKCPACSRTIEHSYEALAEVGTPICSECDIEMELQ